jgi:hypothetical protein
MMCSVQFHSFLMTYSKAKLRITGRKLEDESFYHVGHFMPLCERPQEAMPQLKRYDTRFLRQRPGFNPIVVYMRFMVDTVQVPFKYLGFQLQVVMSPTFRTRTSLFLWCAVGRASWHVTTTSVLSRGFTSTVIFGFFFSACFAG